jgi:hypothetical protein
MPIKFAPNTCQDGEYQDAHGLRKTTIQTFNLRRQGTALISLLTGSLLLFGCNTPPPSDFVLGKSYRPNNKHLMGNRLPDEMLRVLVLPATSELAEGATGLETLEPILLEEIIKSKRFEIVSVSPVRLNQLTGKSRWTAEEPLPPNFLDLMRETFACQAVLFNHLTVYRPYPPLAVGWRVKLVECARDMDIWWSVDEIFDAGNDKVANAARRFRQQEQGYKSPTDDSRGVLISPRRFGQYAASAVVGTLPTREKKN